MVGLAVFSSASLGCALAGSDTFLILMRGVQGLGAAIVLQAALSIPLTPGSLVVARYPAGLPWAAHRSAADIRAQRR